MKARVVGPEGRRSTYFTEPESTKGKMKSSRGRSVDSIDRQTDRKNDMWVCRWLNRPMSE